MLVFMSARWMLRLHLPSSPTTASCRQQVMAQLLGPCCPRQRPSWSSWLLAAVWLSPACVANWGGNQQLEDLSIFLPPLLFRNFAFQTNKLKKKIKCKTGYRKIYNYYLLKVYLLLLGRVTEKDPPSAGSPSNWLQQPELRCSEAGSREGFPGLQRGGRDLRTWAILWCFPRP